MKKILLVLCITAFAGIFVQSNAQSQDDMKKWMDYMTPSDVHKMLAKWDGEWVEEIQIWMAPGTPPQAMQASCVNKMVLGGRYQESTTTGNFNGMPFEGVGTLGWDNIRKVMVNSWVDNMGTGMIYMEGKWNDATKTAELKGKSTDPMSGKSVDIRQVFKIVDDNTQLVEQYSTAQDGKEFKSMEIKFTRKK
jgi:Protein of unknown function (DUF1579)